MNSNDVRLPILLLTLISHTSLHFYKLIYSFIVYLGFNVSFNTVQVISQQVVLSSGETSTYSWSRLRFCTVNCQPLVSNY